MSFTKFEKFSAIISSRVLSVPRSLSYPSGTNNARASALGAIPQAPQVLFIFLHSFFFQFLRLDYLSGLHVH